MALVGGKIQIRTIYHLHLHSQKKENIPYPRCGFGACLGCG